MAAWGKTRGNPLGYKIFVFILKTAGIFPAYGLLRLVTIYYFFFPGKSKAPLHYYFQKRLGYNYLKTKISIYENFNYLGRSLIDKMILMSGISSPFSINHDGVINLEKMVQEGKGGLLISAHVGNWEAAGHLLKRLKTNINIVMYEVEQEKIKEYLEKIRDRSFHVIFIKDDLSHIYEINEALKRNEFVCIHADRFVEGNKTIETNLLGAKAKFPIGPFVLATTFKTPVSFVFALKEGLKHYHFFASRAKIYDKGKQDIPTILNDYTKEIEKMIKVYPLQWHNYFPFWEEEKLV
ncbi:MAG: lipid A biosynthesis acyltransferase [Chitinophagaceae bacterium]|nr:MAG: acyltransferase [Bacteroidetes bacterium OLB11]MCC6447309.1 lipid A biosynthesis acyltransferase [Chitinophagaceae bacterium]HMN31776.1 lipid A biosynthesis acyltransferase [Chitinophagaceae bacterium]